MLSNAITISQLAKEFGISTDTIRYYEKQGLIRPAYRDASGYRRFSEGNKQTLSFILRCRRMGFNLQQTEQLLELDINAEQVVCADVKEFVDLKRKELAAQIQELQIFHQALTQLSLTCSGDTTSATECTILDALHHVSTSTSVVKT